MARAARRPQMRAAAQPGFGVYGPDADELQPARFLHSGTFQQRTADEIAALLQHPRQAEIAGRGGAVQLAAGHMTLLDAQHVQRVQPIGPDAVGRAGFQQCLPDRLGPVRRHRHLEGTLARKRNAEDAAGHAGNGRGAGRHEREMCVRQIQVVHQGR